MKHTLETKKYIVSVGGCRVEGVSERRKKGTSVILLIKINSFESLNKEIEHIRRTKSNFIKN